VEKLTRKEYNDIHPDFKSQRKDWTYSIMKNIDWNTVSVPVEIVD